MCRCTWQAVGTALEDFLASTYPQPNLILLDCEMRSECSLEIVRAMKGNPKTRNIPVIALAQPGDDLYVENLYRCQVNCVLPKPQVVEEATALFTRIEQFWFRVAAYRLRANSERSCLSPRSRKLGRSQSSQEYDIPRSWAGSSRTSRAQLQHSKSLITPLAPPQAGLAIRGADTGR